MTARRVLAARDETADLDSQLELLVKQLAPGLLAQPGVGPVCAAHLFCAWSHRGRLRSEAAFASLAGVAPVEASSGQVLRHRLNRSGDRKLNRVLHTVALCRMQYDAETLAYIARRRQQGTSDREIRRCLKRYLARRFFRLLNQQSGLDKP